VIVSHRLPFDREVQLALQRQRWRQLGRILRRHRSCDGLDLNAHVGRPRIARCGEHRHDQPRLARRHLRAERDRRGTSGSGGGGGGGLSAAQIKANMVGQISPIGAAAKIGRLLSKGSYNLPFTAHVGSTVSRSRQGSDPLAQPGFRDAGRTCRARCSDGARGAQADGQATTAIRGRHPLRARLNQEPADPTASRPETAATTRTGLGVSSSRNSVGCRLTY
jgi:hypothetical protein